MPNKTTGNRSGTGKTSTKKTNTRKNGTGKKSTSVGKGKAQHSKTPIIIAVLAAAGLLSMIFFIMGGFSPGTREVNQNDYFNVHDASSAAVILNGEELEENAKVVGEGIYISYNTVWDSINSGFYLENDTLYMTLPEGTFTWTADDGSGALYFDEEGTAYISAALIKEYSDVELDTFSEPSRVVIRNSWDGLQRVTVTEDAVIRTRSDQKSDIAAHVYTDESLSLLEKGDSWCRVESGDGHTGYIESAYVSEPVDVEHARDPRYYFEPVKYPGTVKMVWHYIDMLSNNRYLDGMMVDTKGINIISPTWFGFSDASGHIYSYADAEYVKKAHETYGLSIWALMTDSGLDGVSTGDIISVKENRQNCISGLIEQSLTYGLEGINIDFETITWDQAPAYLQFLRELTTAAHANGLIVSVDNYVPTYTKQYKRAEQNKIVDYVIIMGYDEHTGSSEEIGSVASIGFVEDGIAETLKEVDADKTVLGVPFYSRGWTEYFGTTEFESRNLDMTEQAGFIQEHGIELYWNEQVGQNMGSAQGEDASYSIWVEDAQSLAKKLELVDKYGIAGASAWRIGTETMDVWEVWDNYLK